MTEKKIENFLEKINFNGNHIKLEQDSEFDKIIYQLRYGTELWRYFVILALFLALIEMWISKSSKKDIAELGYNS